MASTGSGRSVVIPREFSKTKDQIDHIQAKQKKKDGQVGPKDIGDLKREVEMEEHKLPPLEGVRKLADEFEFAPPENIEDHIKNGLSERDAEVSAGYTGTAAVVNGCDCCLPPARSARHQGPGWLPGQSVCMLCCRACFS